MSRIGKKPVTIPSGVTAVSLEAWLVREGPEGHPLDPDADEVTYTLMKDGKLSVKPANGTKRPAAFWGMQRTLVRTS
jgi:large subunit ribosomal protein L6